MRLTVVFPVWTYWDQIFQVLQSICSFGNMPYQETEEIKNGTILLCYLCRIITTIWTLRWTEANDSRITKLETKNILDRVYSIKRKSSVLSYQNMPTLICPFFHYKISISCCTCKRIYSNIWWQFFQSITFSFDWKCMKLNECKHFLYKISVTNGRQLIVYST